VTDDVDLRHRYQHRYFPGSTGGASSTVSISPPAAPSSHSALSTNRRASASARCGSPLPLPRPPPLLDQTPLGLGPTPTPGLGEKSRALTPRLLFDLGGTGTCFLDVAGSFQFRAADLFEGTGGLVHRPLLLETFALAFLDQLEPVDLLAFPFFQAGEDEPGLGLQLGDDDRGEGVDPPVGGGDLLGQPAQAHLVGGEAEQLIDRGLELGGGGVDVGAAAGGGVTAVEPTPPDRLEVDLGDPHPRHGDGPGGEPDLAPGGQRRRPHRLRPVGHFGHGEGVTGTGGDTVELAGFGQHLVGGLAELDHELVALFLEQDPAPARQVEPRPMGQQLRTRRRYLFQGLKRQRVTGVSK
jgi:hypothetical protein